MATCGVARVTGLRPRDVSVWTSSPPRLRSWDLASPSCGSSRLTGRDANGACLRWNCERGNEGLIRNDNEYRHTKERLYGLSRRRWREHNTRCLPPSPIRGDGCVLSSRFRGHACTLQAQSMHTGVHVCTRLQRPGRPRRVTIVHATTQLQPDRSVGVVTQRGLNNPRGIQLRPTNVE